MTDRITRRTVLVTGSAVLLAGCSSYGDGNGDGSAESTSRAPGGQELAKAADIPEGGGKIFKEQKVVVTQPQKGEFKAFSAICTHQGCTVSTVENGTINCPCHGSEFAITDGSVVAGPAPKPLPAQAIKVSGGSITAA